MADALYAQLADALRENAVNREAIEQQDALILHQSDEITQLDAHVAEQADYIALLEQQVVEAQRDLADAQIEVRWLNNILEEQP